MSSNYEFLLNYCYFKITYNYKKMQIPEIETWIFIGKNIKGENEEAWYFQDPDSICKEDNIIKWADDTDALNYFRNLESKILILKKNDPELVLYSAEELIEKLKQIKNNC